LPSALGVMPRLHECRSNQSKDRNWGKYASRELGFVVSLISISTYVTNAVSATMEGTSFTSTAAVTTKYP